MQPADPTDAPMTLKSAETTFRRKENLVDFNQDVVLTRDADRLRADHMIGRFTSDRRSLVGVEGDGHVVIVMADSGAMGAQAASGRKEITCDRFWSEVANDQITAINAGGEQGPARAVIDGPPKRELVAKTFRVGLSNRQVTDLHADFDVVMKEYGPVPREIRGDRLIVYFDPQLHRATNAAIENNFKYKDPKNEAFAIRANYDMLNDHVVLTAAPGFDPTVISEGQTLKAKLIEFSPRAGTAKATGEVIAQLVSKQNGPAADSTNIFPAGKPVFVNSDSVTLRQSTKVAVFTGHVRAWQETNTLFADELQVQGLGDQIGARGNVRTFLYNTSTTEARKTPVVSRSDHFAAHKNDRRVELLGNVKIDDDQRHLTAEKATFYFDASRKLEKIEAENKVVLFEQPAARKGTGDKAIYLVNRRMIYVSGSPATVSGPNGNVSGEQIAIDLARNKVEIMSPGSATKGSYKQQ
jgi:lipopolysaccharide transport protein LptA